MCRRPGMPRDWRCCCSRSGIPRNSVPPAAIRTTATASMAERRPRLGEIDGGITSPADFELPRVELRVERQLSEPHLLDDVLADHDLEAARPVHAVLRLELG